MAIKFGVSQMGVNAPMNWTKIESAVIIVLLPAVSTFLMSVINDPKKQAIAIACVTFVGALVKAVGVFLGDSSNTPQAPTTTTDVTPVNKN